MKVLTSSLAIAFAYSMAARKVQFPYKSKHKLSVRTASFVLPLLLTTNDAPKVKVEKIKIINSEIIDFIKTLRPYFKIAIKVKIGSFQVLEKSQIFF